VTSHDGREVDSRADELFAAFPTAGAACGAAVEMQRSLSAATWPAGCHVKVRIGVNVGAPATEGDVYVGLDVVRAARLCSAGHGGQILTSEAVHRDVADAYDFTTLGPHRLAGIPDPE
jgi:class 3 adenylate cyclase